MKKTQKPIGRTRKLILNREVVAQLTPLDLSKAAGGNFITPGGPETETFTPDQSAPYCLQGGKP